MWLTGELAGQREGQGASAQSGVVTIDAHSAAVYARGEQRGAAVVSPMGLAWRPGGGEPVVLLRGDAQEEAAFVLGVTDTEAELLNPGEICLYSRGGARVLLRNNGRVEITGKLYINGKEYIPLGGD